jgi:hypothetical protein
VKKYNEVKANRRSLPRMNLRRAVGTAISGAAACAVKANRREPWLELHQHDWFILRDDVYRRRFESAGHFIYHLKDLFSIQIPIAEVYILRAITAAFRERIMIVTSLANECSW